MPKCAMFVHEKDLVSQATAHGDLIPTRKKVYVPGGTIPHLTQIASSVSQGGCDTAKDPHTHPTMWEIYLVRKGRAFFSVAGETRECVAGDFVAVPPGASHSYRVPEGETLDLFYFGVATGEGSAKKS